MLIEEGEKLPKTLKASNKFRATSNFLTLRLQSQIVHQFSGMSSCQAPAGAGCKTSANLRFSNREATAYQGQRDSQVFLLSTVSSNKRITFLFLFKLSNVYPMSSSAFFS